VTGEPRRRAFLSLGSNLGDRVDYLEHARAALAALPGTSVVAASRVYETSPQEREDQGAFLNQVVCIDTGLAPHDLLGKCQAIEAQNGRRRDIRFGARTLDIDILLIEGVESDAPELTLPHPRMVGRAFVLVPLLELWGFARGMPDLDVAGLGGTAAGDQRVELYDATKG